MPQLTETPARGRATLVKDSAEVQPVVRSTLRSAVHSHKNRRRAQQLVWEWVGAKWPRLVPPAAVMESGHVRRAWPGQELGVSTSDDGSVWTLSVLHIERGGTRTWMTSAQVADTGETDMLDIQTACSDLANSRPTVAPPRLLGGWVEGLELEDGGVAVQSLPREVNDEAQLAAFCGHVLSPGRRLPVIALANRRNSRYYGVDPGGLAQAVSGLAHVACIAPEMSAGVTEALGRGFGVVPGAARIYTPGFGADPALAHHPLFRNSFTTGQDQAADAGAFRRLLCREVCALSVRMRHPDDSRPSLLSP